MRHSEDSVMELQYWENWSFQLRAYTCIYVHACFDYISVQLSSKERGNKLLFCLVLQYYRVGPQNTDKTTVYHNQRISVLPLKYRMLCKTCILSEEIIFLKWITFCYTSYHLIIALLSHIIIIIHSSSVTSFMLVMVLVDLNHILTLGEPKKENQYTVDMHIHTLIHA